LTMHTSDTSAPDEPGRSSYMGASEPDGAEAPAMCRARTKSEKPCPYQAVANGRCAFHLVDEVVPEDELEALRQLEAAAAQHAIDAHFSNEDGGSEPKDQEFNRNARTAAQLANVRRALKAKKGKRGKKAKSEVVTYEEPDNGRDVTPKGESEDK